MADTVGIGVIGTGYWGPELARNVSVSGRTHLAGLCDADATRLEAVGGRFPNARPYTDPARLLEDPGVAAVAIATPVRTHYGLAKAALQAGKHVLVEKPFTLSSDEACELVELAAEKRRVLMVDHVYLYSPAVAKLVDVYRSGAIGEIRFIDSVRINLGLIRHDVNVVWDLAPHDLSIVDALIERSPVGVVATGPGDCSNGSASVAYVHLDYGDGLQVSLHVSWLSPVKIRHFLVGGTRGSIVLNDLNPSEPLKIYDRGVALGANPEDAHQIQVSYRWGDVLSPDVGRAEPLQVMIDHFATCIVEGTQPRTDGHQGLRLVRILEAVDRSLKQRGKYEVISVD